MRYKWACLDLNQGPSGYEPPALTPELQARTASIARKSRAGREHGDIDTPRHQDLWAGEKEENPLIMNNRYATHTRALIDAVLNSPGETDPGLRHAVEAQSAQLSGRPSQHAGHVPQELVPYLKKVALHAYRTTDNDIETLRRMG